MWNRIRKGLRAQALRFITKNILLFVTTEEVFKVEGNRVFANGKELRASDVRQLVAEAAFIQKSAILPYLTKVLAYGTQERILKQGADTQDLWTARAVRLTQEQLFSALDVFSQLDKTDTARDNT
jgi:hypothetical protein